MNKNLVIIVGIGGLIAGVILLTGAKDKHSLQLHAGWNEPILYNGITQTALQAFRSIEYYMQDARYEDSQGNLQPILQDTILSDGMVLSIWVSQDVLWTY